MDIIDELKLKVEKATGRIKAQKETIRHLTDELKLLREDNVRARKVLRENELLRSGRERLLKKLEKLQHRLESFKI